MDINNENGMFNHIKPKLKVDVNGNPTKKGIKVQFVLPNNVSEDEKNILGQKIQTKLNKELAKYDLTVNIDTDVPFSNVIGFLIRIEEIKLIIKKAFLPKEKKVKRDPQQPKPLEKQTPKVNDPNPN